MVLARVRIAFLVLAPLLLYAIPLASLESGPPLCLWKALLHFDCPGCGMTRALHQVLHLNFTSAFAYNRGVVIVAPLLAWVSARTLWRDVRIVRTEHKTVTA
jgi:hypothetical protein